MSGGVSEQCPSLIPVSGDTNISSSSTPFVMFRVQGAMPMSASHYRVQ